MKKIIALFTIASALMFSGCAAINPTTTAVNPAPKIIAPPSDKAMVVFVHNYPLYRQTIHIYDGDNHIASLFNEEKTYAFVEPGEHTFAATVGMDDIVDIAYAKANLKAGKIYYNTVSREKYGMFQGFGYYVTLNPVHFGNDRDSNNNSNNAWTMWLLKNKLVTLNKDAAQKLKDENEYMQPSYIWGEQYQEWKQLPDNEKAVMIESGALPQMKDAKGDGYHDLALPSKNI